MTASARPRKLTRAALPFVLVVGLAACGEDSKSSESAATPAATSTSAATAEVADLQIATADLVRETSFEDKAGSERALEEAEGKLDGARAGLGEEAEDVEEELGGVERALREGNLEEANREASKLLEVVNEAAGEVTGDDAGTEEGLKTILKEMKGAARDVAEEVRFEDEKGTRRAAEAFEKLFDGSREEIEAESPEAEEEIKAGIADLDEALEGTDDQGQVSEASRTLVEAVDDAIAATR